MFSRSDTRAKPRPGVRPWRTLCVGLLALALPAAAEEHAPKDGYQQIQPRDTPPAGPRDIASGWPQWGRPGPPLPRPGREPGDHLARGWAERAVAPRARRGLLLDCGRRRSPLHHVPACPGRRDRRRLRRRHRRDGVGARLSRTSAGRHAAGLRPGSALDPSPCRRPGLRRRHHRAASRPSTPPAASSCGTAICGRRSAATGCGEAMPPVRSPTARR